MKKWIAFLLALVMCLSLCACGGKGETPFDKIADAHNSEEIIKILGESDDYEEELYEHDNEYLFIYYYDNYECFGYAGQLRVVCGIQLASDDFTKSLQLYGVEKGDRLGEVFTHAQWYFDFDEAGITDKENAVKKIVNAIDGKLGEHERADGNYYWTDVLGNEYELHITDRSLEFRFDK